MATDPKTTVRRLYEELWNQNHPEKADDLFDAAYMDHDPAAPDTGRGPDAFKRVFATYHTAFPDTRFTVDEIIAEGDRVAVRWTAHGTHHGELMGVRPSGKRATVVGTGFYRVRNGKVLESWTTWDALGLLRQIGAIPEPTRA